MEEVILRPLEKSKSLKEVAYAEIKKIMISGKISSKNTYSANHFASMLGISRTPVREAVLQLESEGFLVSQNGKGFQIKEPTNKEIHDFFETRKMMETFLIQNFAAKMTDKDLEYLQIEIDIMKKYTKIDDSAGFIASDKNFHHYFVKKSNNQFLANIMDSLQELITILGLKTIEKLERKDDVIKEHQNIVDALKNKNLNAAIKALSEHLDRTKELLLSREGN